jgi:hypothetical protein
MLRKLSQNSSGLLKDSLTLRSRDFPREFARPVPWLAHEIRIGNRAFTMTMRRWPKPLQARRSP